MDKAFQTWLEGYGGAAKLAKRLGVTEYSVLYWRRRNGWPKVEIILKLIKLSKGQLTFENIIASTRRRTK